MKAPNSKHQHPEKHQAPNTNRRIRCEGRDGAPAPSAPLSGATLRVNPATGVMHSARCTGGDGASAPSLPMPAQFWNLVLGISLELGCWSLSLSPALVGRVTMSVIALATTDPCAPQLRQNLRSNNFKMRNPVLPLLAERGEGRGEELNKNGVSASGATLSEAKTPHPNPLPAWAGRGRRDFARLDEIARAAIRCPEGTPENSPAFQRWVTAGIFQVPQGRQNRMPTNLISPTNVETKSPNSKHQHPEKHQAPTRAFGAVVGTARLRRPRRLAAQPCARITRKARSVPPALRAVTAQARHPYPSPAPVGIWSLELFPAMVGRVTPCAPRLRQDLRSSKFHQRNKVHPLPEGEGRGEGEQCSTILNEHKFSKTPPLGFSAPFVPR